MSKVIIDVKHHLASGCCMWSGIEDVYATRTNQELPDGFLLALSSYGETVLLKMDREKPHFLSTCDGRTKKTYDRIKEVLGLQYQVSEGRTLAYALSSIKKEIDNGSPVILGPLDMYYLPYLKMYHNVHIPMHYVMMVGYDSDKSCVYIYDCDRVELQELPESELIQAWQIEKSPSGGKNGFIRFKLSDTLLNQYELAKVCVKQKAERQLCIKPDFVGVNAYWKLAELLPVWKEQYSKDEYKKHLVAMTEWMGMVPKLPNPILGEKGKDIPYHGNYDRFGVMLSVLGEKYGHSSWIKSGELFQICGKNIEKIVHYIVSDYLKDSDSTTEIKELLLVNGRSAREAYELIRAEQ